MRQFAEIRNLLDSIKALSNDNEKKVLLANFNDIFSLIETREGVISKLKKDLEAKENIISQLINDFQESKDHAESLVQEWLIEQNDKANE